MQTKTYLIAWAVCAAAMLTGCGGGGSSGDSSSNSSSPRSAIEGAWLTNVAPSNQLGYNTIEFVILDDGSLWGVYGSTSGQIQGMQYGSASVGSSSTTPASPTVAGSFTQFDMSGGGTPTSHSFSGSEFGQIPAASLTVTFDNSTPLILGYDTGYDDIVLVASLAGTYTGSANTSGQTPYVLNGITLSGSTLSVPADANGCTAQGTVTPHKTSRGTVVAVWDTSLTFSGAGCVLGNGTTVRGITLPSYDAASGLASMIIMTITPDGKNAYLLTVSRQ